MFRLLSSGLPADPVFPHNLAELGYFIDPSSDEIRSINDPNNYFQFFISKNDRINIMQREAMNSCIREEVIRRLTSLHLDTTLLPLGVSTTEPHIPILTSAGLSNFRRVIILFYEHNQDLGILAQRTLGGSGGINQGSCVDMVKHIQSLPNPPGIILANMGQLRWWRRGAKAITQTSWYSIPAASAVSPSTRFDTFKNTVEGNRNTAEHVSYIMAEVIPEMCRKDVILDIIGVSDGAMKIVEYLNSRCSSSLAQKQNIEAVALCAPYHNENDITNPTVAEFLTKKARAFIISPESAGTELTGPEDVEQATGFGMPVYSLGEPHYTETMLVVGYKTIVDWFEEVHEKS